MNYGISIILVPKSKLCYTLLRIKEIWKIEQKAFVLLLIKHWAFLGAHPAVLRLQGVCMSLELTVGIN